MNTELRDAWREVYGDHAAGKQWFQTLDWSVDAFTKRREIVRTHSWAIPTPEALELIKSVSPAGVIEIGAGVGYWAHLLEGIGVDVLAFDIHVPGQGSGNTYHDENACWTNVREGGPEQTELHPERTLFLSWPPMSEMAYMALTGYGGETVVYVGEGWTGTTADDAFHAELDTNWHETERVYLPQWPGIHDDLTVWKRGPEPSIPK